MNGDQLTFALLVLSLLQASTAALLVVALVKIAALERRTFDVARWMSVHVTSEKSWHRVALWGRR